MIGLSAVPVATLLATAALSTGSVGLWTLRVALAARGRKAAAAAVAAVEAVVFALVFSSVAAGLGAPERLAGHAMGVAAGTILGIGLDERLGRRPARPCSGPAGPER